MPEWEVRRWVSCVLLVFVTSAAKGLAWTKPHTRDILPHNTPSTRPNPPTVDVHAGVDARAHVYDLATRAWALPLILAEGRFSSQKAKQRLEQLIKRMRSEASEDRPSLFFSGVQSPWCCRVYEATTPPAEPTAEPPSGPRREK